MVLQPGHRFVSRVGLHYEFDAGRPSVGVYSAYAVYYAGSKGLIDECDRDLVSPRIQFSVVE